jgi:hypothetical protein
MKKTKHTSTDYSNPYRPKLISFVNFAFKNHGLKGNGAFSLNPNSILSEAESNAGMGIDDAAVVERLGLLCDSLRSEARLHPAGKFMARKNLLRIVSNRIKIDHDFNLMPNLETKTMRDPVFIVGLQRTGTTMLQRILASDEGNFRFLASWEAIYPAPIAGKAKNGGKDQRVKTAELGRKALAYLSPDFSAVHPVEPLGPEEDCLLFDYDFMSTVPEATHRVPGFSRWLEGQNRVSSYRYYKKILQYLQNQRPGGRWILKTPQHMENLDALFEVFPDARIIQTHRDPRSVMASFSSMIAHAHGIFSDEIDPREIGSHWLRKARIMTDMSMSMRSWVYAKNFHDVMYKDIVKDPCSVTEKIYDFLGLGFTEEDRTRIKSWTVNNPQHRYGMHKYRIEDFGFTHGSIMEELRSYRDYFDVPLEECHD